MKKRGISNVVATVLIILIVGLVVFLGWSLFNKFTITDEVDISIVGSEDTVYDENNGLASVKISRGNDNADLQGIGVFFVIGNESVAFEIEKEKVLEVNSKKVYLFNVGKKVGESGLPDSVRIMPLYSLQGSITGAVVGLTGFSVYEAKLKKGTVKPSDDVIYSVGSSEMSVGGEVVQSADVGGGNVGLVGNLIGYWNFDEDPQYPLGIYGNAFISGDGCMAGYGNCLHVDGTGGTWAQVVDEDDFRTEEATWSLWINPEDASSTCYALSYGASGINRLMFGIYGDDFIIHDDINNEGDNTIGSGDELADDGWHHFALVINSDGSKIPYVDGVQKEIDLDGSNLLGLDSGTSDLDIGRGISGSGYCDAEIDDVIVFDRALTEAEVGEVYQGELFGDGGEVPTPNNWCDWTDFNHDGKVGVWDLAILANNYGGTGKTQQEGDATGDGKVDVLDLAKLSNNYGGEGCSGGEVFDFEVSVATLKDTYSVGEVIGLTDPPEVVNDSENLDVDSFVEYSANDLVNDEEKKEDIFSILEYEGYIVELKEESVLEKRKQELDYIENVREKSENSLYKYSVGLLTNLKANYKKKNLDENLKKQEKKIIEKQEEVKKEIVEQLEKQRRGITGNVVYEVEDLEIEQEFTKVFNGFVLNVSEEEAEEIKGLDEVREVYLNMKVYTTLDGSVPLINADDVWGMDGDGNDCLVSGNDCLTGEGITIAIIDSGIDYTHPDLGGCFGAGCKVIGGYDVINGDSDPMDDYGHGTHVAGTAAGDGVLRGVAPDAKLYAYKVLDDWGAGTVGNIVFGIEMATDPNQDGDFSDKLDIMSLSLGGYGNSEDPMSRAVDTAVDNGVVVVVSAGNSGPGFATISSPGTAKKAITVGASDDFDDIAEFSSRGPANGMIKPDVLAPGVEICSAQSSLDVIWEIVRSEYRRDIHCLDNEHISISGTSMATPHVAGAVALLKQKNPDWTPEEIKYTLRGTSIDIGEVAFTQGAGRIDVLNAIQSERTYPLASIKLEDLIYNGEDIEARITASGENFNEFRIYYFPSDNFEASENFNMIYNSSVPLVDETLLLPLSQFSLERGRKFIIKLEVENDAGISEDYAYLGGYAALSQIIDLEGYILYPPIIDSLAFGEGKSLVMVLRNLLFFGGENFFKVVSLDSLEEFKNPLLLVETSLTDLDSDGSKESLSVGRLGDYSGATKLYALDSEANIRTQDNWPHLNEDLEYYGLIIDDIESDGQKEVLVIGAGQHLISHEGEILGWYPRFSDSILNSLVIIIDINGDGVKEIVGVEDSYQFPRLIAYESNGGLIGDWFVDLPQGIQGLNPRGYLRTIAGDIDNDGINNLIIWGLEGVQSSGVLMVDLGMKEIIWQEEIFISPRLTRGQLLMGDLTGDSFPEIVLVGKDFDTNIPKMIILDNQGNVLNEIELTSNVNFAYPNAIIIEDINGDGINEIIYASDKIYFYKWDGSYAEEPVELGLVGDLVFPIVGDFDEDGDTDLIAFYNGAGIVSGKSFGAYIFDFPYDYENSETAWPSPYYDSENTRCYRCKDMKPQSKIVNNEDFDITENLIIKIQKDVGGGYGDYQVVYVEEVTISANDLIKLDIGEDSLGNSVFPGFNNLNVVVNEVGIYRVHVEFNGGMETWEFEVV